MQDGRIYIEKINGPLLKEGGSPAEYKAGLDLAIVITVLFDGAKDQLACTGILSPPSG